MKGEWVMKYYLVKTVSTATDENPGFSGQIETTYNGVGDYLLFSDAPYYYGHLNLLNAYFIEEYGYKSEALAKRCYSYKHPQNDRNWTSTVSIECFDI